MRLERGDIFCTRNPMMLGRAINFVQKVWSKDNKSEYSHSGIIIEGGDLKQCYSFEALWTNKIHGFYKAYKGRKVLIGRHKGMNYQTFDAGWEGVKKHKDKWYAGYRLPLFFIPFLAKYINFGLGVCSELTMKFLYKAGLADTWKGWNPDDVADMVHKWKNYDIIYEGVLHEKL